MTHLLLAQMGQGEQIMLGIGVALYAVSKAIELVKGKRETKFNEQMLEESITRTQVLQELLKNSEHQSDTLSKMTLNLAVAMERQVTKESMGNVCRFRK